MKTDLTDEFNMAECKPRNKQFDLSFSGKTEISLTLTVCSRMHPVVARDLVDVDVERQRPLVGVVVAELAVEQHLPVVVAD